MNEKRARIFERVEPAKTPAEALQRRSSAMIALGAIAFVWGFLAAVSGGNPGAWLLALLGVGLLVGGLAIRR